MLFRSVNCKILCNFFFFWIIYFPPKIINKSDCFLSFLLLFSSEINNKRFNFRNEKIGIEGLFVATLKFEDYFINNKRFKFRNEKSGDFYGCQIRCSYRRILISLYFSLKSRTCILGHILVLVNSDPEIFKNTIFFKNDKPKYHDFVEYRKIAWPLPRDAATFFFFFFWFGLLMLQFKKKKRGGCFPGMRPRHYFVLLLRIL